MLPQKEMGTDVAIQKINELINGAIRNGYFADHNAVGEMVAALNTLANKSLIGDQLIKQKQEEVKRNTENERLQKQLFPTDTISVNKPVTDGNNI